MVVKPSVLRVTSGVEESRAERKAIGVNWGRVALGVAIAVVIIGLLYGPLYLVFSS